MYPSSAVSFIRRSSTPSHTYLVDHPVLRHQSLALKQLRLQLHVVHRSAPAYLINEHVGNKRVYLCARSLLGPRIAPPPSLSPRPSVPPCTSPPLPLALLTYRRRPESRDSSVGSAPSVTYAYVPPEPGTRHCCRRRQRPKTAVRGS
jgi:hypothetical protein